MRVLALDPGWNTGWAWLDFNNNKIDVLDQGTIEGGLDAFLKDSPLYSVNLDDQIVIEDFVPDGTVVGREATYSSLIIGASVAFHYEYDFGGNIVMQPRSDKASLYGETEAERFEFLRRNGFTGTRHELDAITHALVYAKRQGHEGVKRLILNG